MEPGEIIHQTDDLLQRMQPIPYFMLIHIAVRIIAFIAGIVLCVFVLKETRTFFSRYFLGALVMLILVYNAVPDFMWQEATWQNYLEPSARGIAGIILFIIAAKLYYKYIVTPAPHKKERETDT